MTDDLYPKLTKNQLLVLRDLIEHGYVLRYTRSYFGSKATHEMWMVDRAGERTVDRRSLGSALTNYLARAKETREKLIDHGLIRPVTEDDQPEILPENGGWGDPLFDYYLPTPLAHAYWTMEGEAVLNKYVQADKEKRKSVERLLIVSGSTGTGAGGGRDYRQAGWLVRVTNETPKRTYVEIIKSAEDVDPEAKVARHTRFEGWGEDTRLHYNSFTVDGATEAQFDRMVRAESEILRDKAELAAQRDADIEDAVAPIRERYKQREAQQAAMHEQMMKEAKDG